MLFTVLFLDTPDAVFNKLKLCLNQLENGALGEVLEILRSPDNGR